MEKIIYRKSLLSFAKIKRAVGLMILFLVVSSCSENENLDVDLTTYNSDTYVPTAVDEWITENLTDPYNIQVVYRFERSLTDVSRDISPAKLEQVQPTMQMVLDGFLKVYEKVAGPTFIKTLTPKQFVLYGSVSYNTNGSVTLGTADGGRRVVLYDLNNLNVANANDVRGRLRTIHHEFTHIVNQNIVIPPNFELVSAADYFADWTNSANSETVSKNLGFVSRYARSSFEEDFAEMTAHLLVEGQIWFDNYVMTASATAQTKLREKETIVRDYFRTYYDVDFSELQAEVQRVLRTNYGATDPVDLTQTLGAWLAANRVNTITYTPGASHYATYGTSTAFNSLYTNFRNEFRASYATWEINYFQFIFTSASTMTFRVGFNTGTATIYAADYYFSFTVNPSTGAVQFTKTTSGGLQYNDFGQYPLNAFEKYMLPYLTNRGFVAAWLPVGINASNSLYRTFGGFYVQGATTNYFYGPIVLK